MGNTFSNPDQVNIEDFKDQVFGTTVFLLSKAINPHLEFRSRDECTSDHLPLPKVDSDNIYEIALSYYNYLDHKGTDKDLDYQIEEYVNKNILNSKENVTRFYKILIDKLMAKQSKPMARDASSSSRTHSEAISNQAVAPVRKVVKRSVQQGGATESNHSYVSRQSVQQSQAKSPPLKPVQQRTQLRPVSQSQQSNTTVPQHTYQQRSQAGQQAPANVERVRVNVRKLDDTQSNHSIRTVGTTGTVETTGTRGTRGTARTQDTSRTTRTQRTNRTTKSAKNGTRAPPPSPKASSQIRARPKVVDTQVPRVSQEFQLAYPKAKEVNPESYVQVQQVPPPEVAYPGNLVAYPGNLVDMQMSSVASGQGGQGDVASNYTAQSQLAYFGTCLLSETDSLVKQPKLPFEQEASEQPEVARATIALAASDQEEYVTDQSPEEFVEEEYIGENEPRQEEAQPQVSYEEYDGDELEYEEYDTLPEH